MVRFLSLAVFRELIALLAIRRPLNLLDYRMCLWSFGLTELWLER